MSETRIKVEAVGLDEVVKNLSRRYPEWADRARRSALASTGNMIRQELRNHIEYGGTGWPSLHPLSKRRKDTAGIWKGTSRSKHSPLFWLGKFARYAESSKGERVTVGFGKSRKGRRGFYDKQLYAMAIRYEYGYEIKVTDQMRRKMSWTRLPGKKKKEQTPGVDYFPLKKTTTSLKVPARPSIGPIFRKVRPKVPKYMQIKFWAAFHRYQTEAPKE